MGFSGLRQTYPQGYPPKVVLARYRMRRAAPARLEREYRFLYNLAMKTTLDLDDELVRRAKTQAARERKSLTAIIEEGLRLRLRRRSSGQSGALDLPVFRGGKGFVAGIDPNSNRSIYDAADGDA